MSYNKIIMIGNLTRDPELKAIPSGTQVCKFGIAATHRSNGKEDVCFVECTAWGLTGEHVSKYFKKGSPIFIEGRLRLETWEKDGKTNSKHVILVERTQFIGKSIAQDQAAPMVNENKRIMPFPSDIKRAQQEQYAPKSGQKSLESNILDGDELPF